MGASNSKAALAARLRVTRCHAVRSSAHVEIHLRDRSRNGAFAFPSYFNLGTTTRARARRSTRSTWSGTLTTTSTTSGSCSRCRPAAPAAAPPRTHSGCATLWSMAVRGRGGALRGRVCSRLRAFAATRLSPTVGEERAACTCRRCGWLRRYTVGADRSAV